MHQLIKHGIRTVAPVLALAALAGTGSVHAQNLLQNGSFESGAFVNNGLGAMSLNPGATTITGWTVTNAELAWEINGAYGLDASDGSYFLDLTGYHDATPYGGVTQSFATVAGSSYHLAFDLGTNQSNRLYTGPISVSALVGDGSTNQTFLANYAPGGTGNQHQTFGYDFVASSPFTSLTLTGLTGNQYIGLDNVSVTSNGVPPVPEASTSVSLGLLVALGLGGFFATRRRKSAV